MGLHGSLRRLVWIPIVHTQEDMGGLRDSVRRRYIERYGRKTWEEHLRAVQAIWAGIRRKIEEFDCVGERLRLYQDGLPVCEREEAIVRDLAAAGSINHSLLLDLMNRGGKLTGTESPELLVAEYNLALRLLNAPAADPGEQAEAFKRKCRELLDQRDQFIAERIDRTLEPGETGLIFLGMLHSLDGRIAPDIQVTKLELAEPPAVSSHRRVETPDQDVSDRNPATLSEPRSGPRVQSVEERTT